MARPQVHTSSPLFKLRCILGEESPLTQETFARLAGVPYETVRSIEGGRRSKEGPSEEVLAKIKDATAAAWNAKENLWEFAFKPKSSKALIPFSHAIYIEYRRWLETPPDAEGKSRWTNLTSLKIGSLLASSSDPKWYPLLFKIHKAISDWRREFEISGQVRIPHDGPLVDLERFLEDSRPTFVISFDKHTGKVTLLPSVAGMTDGLPANYRDKVLDPAKPGKKT